MAEFEGRNIISNKLGGFSNQSVCMINQKDGKSVYLVSESRIFNPQYVAARETIEKYSKKKVVLELGGGPLHSTGILMNEGYKVINLEIDDSLIDYCKKTYPKTKSIKTNLELGLPKFSGIHKADVIVALDFLEHLEYKNTMKLLRQIREVKMGEKFVIIAVIPITDWLKVPTWFDWFRRFTDPKNVNKGLFDPTHKWFATQTRHRKMFEECGYTIIEEQTTNAIDAITGDWKTLDLSKITWIKNPIPWVQKSIKLAQIIAFVFHPFDLLRREKMTRELLSQRGFYVVRSTT